ncbi:MAG: transcription-repair coupling factor, partial [Gammaproteobacteria bacterium]|nr:transcription-repair coupling factor [Gammaproteobacteria bacterium]
MPTEFLLSPAAADRLTAPSADGVAIGRLVGASAALAAVELAMQAGRLVIVLANDPRHADQLEAEARWFGGGDLYVAHFVEWETLPYDSFSPHQDIVSQRLDVLASIGVRRQGIVILSSPALLQRLPPADYVAARTLLLSSGQRLDRQAFIDSLVGCGYLRVPQVDQHGEFAIRGSLLDVFPMGSDKPFRVDFFDDEVESLRDFDPESQLSGDRLPEIRILPAREVPLDEDGIRHFRHAYRERFEGRPTASRVYRDVSDGIAHGGIEYYLPLFFESTAGFQDYLPHDAVLMVPDDLAGILDQAWDEIGERYELCSLDPERPVLKPEESFFRPEDVAAALGRFTTIACSTRTLADGALNLPTRMPPAVRVEARYEDAAASLMRFIGDFDGRMLFTAD